MEKEEQKSQQEGTEAIVVAEAGKEAGGDSKGENKETMLVEAKGGDKKGTEGQNQQEGGKKRDYFKQKFNVFFGYNGKKFSGSQKNPGVETVEDALEKALHQAGFISDDNFGDLHKTGWSRASRTDKGVHAAMNGVCTKLIIRDDYLKDDVTQKDRDEGKSQLKLHIDREKVIAAINAVIHKDVHVVGLRLVSRNYAIKNTVSSRRYEYIAPIKLFYPYKDPEQYSQELAQDATENARIIARLQTLAKKYEGTKNFHNYTKKSNPHDKRNKRYIMKIDVEEIPAAQLEQIYGKPTKNTYLKVSLHGQSFIYHQIRKMMGMLIQSLQEGLDECFMDNSFCNNKMPVWLAPSEGLLLNRLLFQSYNQKKGIAETMELTAEEEAQIEEFKVENIYKCILAFEEEQKVFTNWIVDYKKNNPY